MSENPAEDSNEETLKLEISKLKQEIRNLEYSNWWINRLLQSLSLITTLLAVFAFGFGIYQFYLQQQKDAETQRIENEKRQNEILRLDRQFQEKIFEVEKQNRNKFYERQLDIYYNLSETAAKTAIESDVNKRAALYRNFLELYHGKFIIADYKGEIKLAAAQFDSAYRDNPSPDNLKPAADKLAAACRDSIKEFWGLR